MRGFATIDLMFMTKELQTLIGGRIDKIYHLDNDIYIYIYITSKGKKLLRIKPNKAWLTTYKPEFEELGHFAETLRKHIGNARIKTIKQVKSERILEITLEKEKEYKLYIEFFSNGNIILEKEGKIICARIERKWKDRTIRRGQKYEMPPEVTDLLNITEEQVNKAVKDNSVSQALAILGFGKDYAFEICLRTGISPNQVNADSKRLIKAIKEILNSEINPQVYYEAEKAVDATPIPFISKKQKNVSTQTFSAAIELVEEKPVKKDKAQGEADKVGGIIKKQKEQIKISEEKAALEQRRGELIYEKYQELKEIIEKIKKKQELPENVTIDWEKKRVKIKLKDEKK